MVVLVAALATVAATSSNAGVNPTKGSGCLVTDANSVGYFDPDCSYHAIYSQDLTLLKYQDHGQLPAGAALPTRAIVRTACYFGFLSREVITPSGDYKSTLLGLC
jgi:hypothetical protein